MTRLSLTPSLLALVVAGCSEPAGGPAGCPNDKCDTQESTPLVLCEEHPIAANTPVFASAEEPEVYYALPSDIAITRVASHYPLLVSGSGSFSEEELEASPFFGRNRVTIDFGLQTAEPLEELASLLAESGSAPEVRRLQAPIAASNPIAIAWSVPDAGDLLEETIVASERGFVAELILTEQGHNDLLRFLRERVGVTRAEVPVSITCVDGDGTVQERSLFPQASAASIEYQADGIELAEPTEPLEGALAIMAHWKVLEGELEWVETWHDGPVLDPDPYRTESKRALLELIPYGDGSVGVEGVRAAGEAIADLVIDAFIEHLDTFDLETAEPRAHLETVHEVWLEGETSEVELTPIDSTFANIHARARALTDFEESPPTIEPFN